MKLGGGIVGLALVCAVALLVPAGAGAVDSDLKFAYAFKVEGSNGYSIIALAANERADGRGEIVLFVTRKRESAVYAAPALLTATSVRATLGALGRVSLAVTRSGRTKEQRFRCGEELHTESYEPVSFSGSLEFRGEERYTEAASDAPTEVSRFFSRLGCGVSVGRIETAGRRLPGARLRARSLGDGPRFELQANKNRPNKRSRFEVDLREERGPISISRHTEVWLGSTAFQYDPLLETATLQPPAPFSGRANFYRRLAPENRWSGNLTVDLPGRSGLPLTGSRIQATLVPGCLREGKGPLHC
ncbi:MAG TPA: hypothetical protein VFX85_01485 [Solirubrobacterales bacterium]|nr:hypothetical protein [Solirubrobacterales bacterium]